MCVCVHAHAWSGAAGGAQERACVHAPFAYISMSILMCACKLACVDWGLSHVFICVCPPLPEQHMLPEPSSAGALSHKGACAQLQLASSSNARTARKDGGVIIPPMRFPHKNPPCSKPSGLGCAALRGRRPNTRSCPPTAACPLCRRVYVCVRMLCLCAHVCAAGQQARPFAIP